METLTLEINNPATIQAIADAAAQKGVTADAYALDLLETALHIAGAANGAVTGQPLASAHLDQFKAALESLSEGTEHLPAMPIAYNREDIYFDHD
jgi:predicted transcriptional regulator